MRVPPEDDGADLLEKVVRHLPGDQAASILSQPRHDFVTWINAYLAVHRTEVELPPELNTAFTRRVLHEVGTLPASRATTSTTTGITASTPEIPAQRPQSGPLPSAPSYLPPPILE